MKETAAGSGLRGQQEDCRRTAGGQPGAILLLLLLSQFYWSEEVARATVDVQLLLLRATLQLVQLTLDQTEGIHYYGCPRKYNIHRRAHKLTHLLWEARLKIKR